jgi:YVTN family beta-propeller protein
LHVSCLLALLLASSAGAQSSFVAFESGPVRPIVLSPNGTQLFVANTPANRLDVFNVVASGIIPSASIPVGLEPVAVAARTDNEVWVVNHLSDSVSIVDVPSGRVVRTLLVGDEPRDIVFAGTSGDRAFITTAHRGQHRTHGSISGVSGAGDPGFTSEGIGRADVWVFDATALGSTIGGTPLEILTFFADTPRALAATSDGATVYAGAFHSGNQTTTIIETSVPNGFDGAGPSSCPAGGTAPGGVPGPDDNFAGAPAPETGLIVKFDGAAWRDALGRDWTGCVNLSLPDHDVFSINANTLAAGSVQEFDHVGTILFNMVVNPVSGKVYVTNLEMPNHIRFEGPGNHGGTTVQGRLSESRITVLDPGGPSADSQHLNQHIDYTKLHTDVPDLVDVTQIDHSLATPLQPVVSSDGNTLYVAAFGSGKVGVFSTTDIEDAAFETNFDPTVKSAAYLDVPGGPAGLALDEARNRLYVATRCDNAVSVMDLASGTEVHRLPLLNPEPESITEGRPVLYDAAATSGNGEASCSSCHIFADFDSLAWNLGDPDAGVSSNTQPIATPLLIPGGPVAPAQNSTTFHPMKGPMTTQTLRGLATHGGMHWRGDRVDGHFGTDPCNKAGYNENAIGDPTNTSTTSPCDEDLSFRNFIVAFEGLVGHDGLIPDADMQKFTDFILQVRLPPNPVTPLNNTYVGDALAGRGVFFSCGPDTTECAPGDPAATDQVDDCDGCHNLDPIHGLFGTGGEQTFEGETQNFKVAHMRNMYQKVGMFGTSANGTFLGDQVRGTGFLHDGSIDTVFDFLTVGTAFPGLGPGEPEELEQFSLEFPTDLAPVVGQQVTLVGAGNLDTNGRITLLIAQAGTSFDSAVLGGTVTECDLVVKGVLNGEARGWVYQPGGAIFQSDRAAQTHTDAQLRNVALTAGQELTYTCVPPGSGERIGIDADEDGAFDRDELDAGTGPDNAGSILGACSDGLDNDGDGLFDAADPGCIGIRSPNSENPACNDGVDNDGDGLTDYTVDVDMNGITDPPGDPVCIAADAVSERAGCQDGVNNDGQFGTDWDGGESVLGVGNGDPNGADPQCGVPWRQREATAATGSSCGLGVELALLLPLLGLGYRSRRRRA